MTPRMDDTSSVDPTAIDGMNQGHEGLGQGFEGEAHGLTAGPVEGMQRFAAGGMDPLGAMIRAAVAAFLGGGV